MMKQGFFFFFFGPLNGGSFNVSFFNNEVKTKSGP